LRRVEGSLMAFTYRDLQFVTKNFSEKLGGGAFGSVFKGALPDSTLVAVKKLEGVRQGEKQFRAEVSTIGTVQHVNLIKLLGFCSQRTRRLLVYEHMPRGSLDRHLFETSSSHGVLSWETRYQIALGVARGLEYLAPEWIAGTAITTKADVFSYGMMLFEIVSGRRNVGRPDDGGAVDFFPSTAAGLLVGGGDLMGAVDGRIRGDADVAEMERACRIACWCVQDDERARPSMGTVVQVLEGLLEVSVPPIPTSFKMLANPSKKHLDFFTCLPSA